MVAAGRFREDLYYRLKGIEIDVPALRARAADVPELVRHFLGRIADERQTHPAPRVPGGSGGAHPLPVAGQHPRAGRTSSAR